MTHSREFLRAGTCDAPAVMRAAKSLAPVVALMANIPRFLMRADGRDSVT